MTTSNGRPHPRFKTELLEFDTGDFWEIRCSLSVALDREFTEVALRSQETLKEGFADTGLVAELARRMDALVLKCTTDWSYGELTAEVLHNEVPAEHYQTVGARMAELFTPLVLKRVEALLSASSSLSSPEASSPSPTSS